jgi:hypothetical protein
MLQRYCDGPSTLDERLHERSSVGREPYGSRPRAEILEQLQQFDKLFEQLPLQGWYKEMLKTRDELFLELEAIEKELDKGRK